MPTLVAWTITALIGQSLLLLLASGTRDSGFVAISVLIASLVFWLGLFIIALVRPASAFPFWMVRFGWLPTTLLLAWSNYCILRYCILPHLNWFPR